MNLMRLLSLVLLLVGSIHLYGQLDIQMDDLSKANTEDIIGVRAIDVYGEVHVIGVENKKVSPVAFVFVDIGCVISQRFIPHLNELYQLSEAENVKFYGIVSNPNVHWGEAQAFVDEYKIEFPLLYDANGDLAQRMNPVVVPESFVYDIYDRRVYYGRVNDQFSEIGSFNKQIRNADLKNAIQAVADGKTVDVLHQPAKGCIFESWDDKKQTVNFNQHIEPIIRANCGSCHRPNDIGPFSLITYNDVARRARMIEYVTKVGYMPIWKATKGEGKFANEHRLSDYQIGLISKWTNSGKEEGKTKDLMPQPKAPESEWKLGEPDLILKMEPYDLPASGDDQYRVFVMKNAIPKGKVIQAIDFKPGDKAVVHHSTIFVDYTRTLRKYDQEDPAPGYDAFEKGGTMEFGSAITIGNWAPGVGPYAYPEGVGFYVEHGADLAFENHYHLSGKATTDESYIGVYFADKTPDKYITGSIMGTQKLHIEAGDSNATKKVWAYVPADIELFDLTPHMHYIGEEVRVEVEFPSGEKQVLLDLKKWDLRWQSVYTLRELMLIPKGSIITAEFRFDNSDDNHDNPYFPAQDMYWGWGSNDEMCEVYFSYVPVHFEDYGKMLGASFAAFEHFYPEEERVVVTENNIRDIALDYGKVDLWSDEGQIMLISIVESCLSAEVLKEMKTNKEAFNDVDNYTVNRAELALMEAYFSLDEAKMISEAKKAASVYEEVLRRNPENWNASMSLGKLLLTSQVGAYMKQGASIVRDLIEWQETQETQDKFWHAYWELGKYYYSIPNDEKAERVLTDGLTYFPNNYDLRQELASEGRITKKKLN